jgi:cobalt/nickel transport system permease protein
MHIPDGFLNAPTLVITGGLAVLGVTLALRDAAQTVPASRRPLMGLAAAFVFAAQMINFPIPGGTSGHLLGSVLSAVLLGPSAAVVVLTSVLIVQCFLFSDGGVIALGANIFNLAIVASLSGYGVYRILHQLVRGARGLIFAATCAAWCSTVVAAITCAGELAWSGNVSWPTAFTAMANVHFLIGLGEGLITALVLAAITRTRPDLLQRSGSSSSSPLRLSLIGLCLLLAVGLALFVAPFACPWPDGLEKVAADLGFAGQAKAVLTAVPFADYQVPGIASPFLTTAMAGAIGTVITFGLAWFLARRLLPGSSPPESRP